ncbi:hypothetical protein Tco_0666507, partial [Tanacetum coccineum]
MCRQLLPPPLSPPSAMLTIMALEEYEYQSRRGIRVPKKWRHKARQQDKVYEEREESCWILHLRTSIFYPKGHEGVMNEVPNGAAILHP